MRASGIHGSGYQACQCTRSQPLLLVEDNLINQQVAAGMHQLLGYRADVVGIAKAHLCALRKTEYTLVLTDCRIPDMDGYQLSTLIRYPRHRSASNPSIPIIPVRSAALDPVITRWTGGAGADSAAIAPAEPDQDQAQRGKTRTLDMDSSVKVEFDAEDLVKRLMGNDSLAKRVAGLFIESMPQQLAALAVAIHQSDLKATAFAAHAIKGAAANVGGVVVRSLAARLEKMEQTGTGASEVLSELENAFQSLKPIIQRFCDTA